MIAITRDISPRFADCELTHLDRQPIALPLALREHEAYRKALESLGVEVLRLPADENHPDCVFVEDTAIVLPHVAVITRPGARSRRGETAAVAAVLGRYRRLEEIEAPATIDGGDVLVAGGRIYVGVSGRTNEAAIDQLRRLTGWEVRAVPVTGCLHLKSAVTLVGENTLLMNTAWIDPAQFEEFQIIEAQEEQGANALRVGSKVIYSTAYPRTRAALEGAGIDLLLVDAGEVAKAEGAVTCCSILVE